MRRSRTALSAHSAGRPGALGALRAAPGWATLDLPWRACTHTHTHIHPTEMGEMAVLFGY